MDWELWKCQPGWWYHFFFCIDATLGLQRRDVDEIKNGIPGDPSIFGNDTILAKNFTMGLPESEAKRTCRNRTDGVIVNYCGREAAGFESVRNRKERCGRRTNAQR